MGKRIYFLRHAQSAWNEAVHEQGHADPIIWDAPLTKKGEDQALQARRDVRRIVDLELIIVSPLSRALHTCELAFLEHIERGVRVIVEPLAREKVTGADDLGSTRDQLVARHPTFDFSRLNDKEVWWYTGSQDACEVDVNVLTSRERYLKSSFKEPEEVFQPRLEAWRQYLLSRPEQTIAVVTHGDITQSLIGLEMYNCELVCVLGRPAGSVAPQGEPLFPFVTRQRLVLADRLVTVERTDLGAAGVRVSIEDGATSEMFVGHSESSADTHVALGSALALFNKQFDEVAEAEWVSSQGRFVEKHDSQKSHDSRPRA